MSYNHRPPYLGLSFFNCGGLRYWLPKQLELRESIEKRLTQCVSNTLLDMNQMWRVVKVAAPIMLPREAVSDQYTEDDIFVLRDAPVKDAEYVLRAETTYGSYVLAEHMLKTGELKAPCCVYQSGESFRRELNDGATASKLRFNAFNQLEYQCIYSSTTTAPIGDLLRTALRYECERILNRPCQLVASDRLPSYSEETIDIEAWVADGKGSGEWREVASTSRRVDFPDIPGHKHAYNVFEIAFGLDRLVALAA